MRATVVMNVLVVAAAAIGALAGSGSAKNVGVHACMEGNDTLKSTAFLSVYCGPASAVVKTKGASKRPIKPGTCVKGIRGPGSWDLYLGTDKSGAGPWPRHLHLSKPTANAKPGLYMEEGLTQWAGLSSIKLTITARGGSFSGTALRREKGKVADPRAAIKGAFTC